MRDVRYFLSLLITMIFNLHPIAANIFHAQDDLASLQGLKGLVTQALEEYIRLEEMRVELVKGKLLNSGLLNENDGHDGHRGVMDNPINAFLTVKALSLDLNGVMESALDKSNMEALETTLKGLKETRKFPETEDLEGAALALTRLQKTYDLRTELISQGCLQHNGCIRKTPLSVEGCFEIGKHNYQARNYDYAIQWFDEALRKLNETSNMNSNMKLMRRIDETEILEYLTWSKNLKEYIHMGKHLLSEWTGIEVDSFIDEVIKVAEWEGTQGEAEDRYSVVLKKYESLCRGDQDLIPSPPSLKCRYKITPPFSILNPLKEEQVHLDPPIFMFHEVLDDNEIEGLKKLARPKYQPATILNSGTGGVEQSSVRVGKTAWFSDNEDSDVDRIILKISRRIERLTSLDLRTAEDLQIANYGIGGMYLPHYDYSHTNETIQLLPESEGNRIATLMFYLSSVEVGGATVFPHLNLRIHPEKGAALFWYNLKPDGRGDYRTQHGACPVLIGNKWVANKWIHERGQEFRRPCELYRNDGKRRQ